MVYDYLLDLFDMGRRHGLYASVTTNGYYTTRSLKKLVEAGVDGWSIDIKGCPMMRRAIASVDHEIIFRNARYVLDMGGHVEMIYLVVTNTNDFDECVDWIIDKHLKYLGPQIPLHINRYYPANHWREPPAPIKKLLSITEHARRSGIEYVYVGNINDPEQETTRCPRCGKILIRRRWYRVTYFNLDRRGDAYYCPNCGYKINVKGRYIPYK